MSISLNDILPSPSNDPDEFARRDFWLRKHNVEEKQQMAPPGSMALATREPPPYGRRKGFVPRLKEDFADGGAFPEVHVAQFPLEMGRKSGSGGPGTAASKTLALTVDNDGKIQYDALIKQGQGKDKVVYSRLRDLKEKIIDDDDDTLRRPDDEKIQEITEKTREALEKITQTKVAAALPVQRAEKLGPAQYIRYTPAQQGPAYNSGASQRIIRMVEEQKDPMEPPRFRINQKIPKPPPSPPAPVMHSPTRKPTAKEQAEWKIPPCVSNWKNIKGYTVPLDKRLAADGRGLQQVHINENFAKLAESLYIADRKAREAVETRSALERKKAQKEKEEKEDRMRKMALKAREERAGIRTVGATKDDDAKEREDIRRERAQERRRERNIERMAPERRSKLQREKDRDISEQIALNMPDARAKQSAETQFDTRLFNQSKGLDAGGGLDDEGYAVYDKPWRSEQATSQSIYRPSKNVDQDVYGGDIEKIISTQKFVPEKGFQGAEGGTATAGGGGRREGPVQFERHQEEDDPFGLGKFLDEAKRTTKRGREDRDKDREPASKRKA